MKKRNILLTAAIILLLVTITSCGPGPLAGPTFTPTFTLTPTNSLTPTPTLTQTPTPDPYQMRSTNFANLTDLNGAEIYAWPIPSDQQLSIDTTNVHSGGKSIKDSGRVDNNHILQTVFYIHGLTGRNTIDLADKMLSIEMYVPSGSPLSYLAIELVSGNNNIIVRANIRPQKGQWYTYEADTQMDIALGSWQYFDWLHSSGISSTADAIDLLNNVQIIKVDGANDSALNAGALNARGETYFLIDELGYAPSGALPAYNPSVDSLRKYAEARNLPVGAFIESSGSSDPQYLRTFLDEFDLGSTQAIYWPTTEPAGDNFDAAVQVPADVFLENVAGRLGSRLIRYAIQDIPSWLGARSFADAQTVLKNYVRAQVSYHKGKTKIWYVFNELLRNDIGNGYVPSSSTDLGLKDRNSCPKTWENNCSPFSSSTSDVTQIEAAFRVAREADPGALLFLNDYGVEKGTQRADAYYTLVTTLVRDHTPIDGVGLETHLMIDKDGQVLDVGSPMAFNSTDGLTGVAENVERYEALGLKVTFSEVDVPIWTADVDSTPAGQQRLAGRLQLQAEVYRSLMHIALTHSNVVAFVFQGWADQYSWVDYTWSGITYCQGYGDLGIFDMDYQPKPAYDALLDELKTP